MSSARAKNRGGGGSVAEIAVAPEDMAALAELVVDFDVHRIVVKAAASAGRVVIGRSRRIGAGMNARSANACGERYCVGMKSFTKGAGPVPVMTRGL